MKAAERFFLPLAALLLAALAALQLTTAAQECQSFDEHVHLAAGYACLKTGVYAFSMDHPAFARLIAAAPLLLLNPDLPIHSIAWKEYRERELGIEFLYHNRIAPDRMLRLARLPMMAMALLFGAALAWWTRRKFGAAAALAALALYCLDPNIVAHSRYVATDMPLVAFYFLTVAAAVEYLETARPRHLLLTCLLFGLAMVTKYSAVLLLPVLALLYAIRWWQRPREFPLRRLLVAAAALAGITAAVVVVVYWPETLRCLRGHADSFAEWGDRRTAIGRILRWMGAWFNLPTHTYLFGLQLIGDHNRAGHAAYLLGQHSMLGWWYYFPVAFLVKSTMAALAATAAALAAGISWLFRHRLRETPLVSYGLLAAPALFFAASMASTINIGLRHILPVYPFLYVAAVAVLTRARWRFSSALLALVLTLQAVECAAIYPHYTAFFNALSGGPGNGPHYLVDSNDDWGQDVKKLALWLRAQGTNRVYFRYFGNGQPEREGLDCLPVPGTNDSAGRAAVNGYVAVSVTYLMGDYVPPEEYAWLRERKPAAKVGYSIYVYDLKTR